MMAAMMLMAGGMAFAQQPEQPDKPANIISAVIRLIGRIFGSLKGFFR